MNWHSMTIRHKLFLGFGLILLITVLFGAILLSGLFSINKSSHSLYNEKIPALSYTYQLQNHWQQAIFNLRSFSNSKDDTYYILANHHLSQAEKTLSRLMEASDNLQSNKWQHIEKELSGFRKQSAKAYVAAGIVEKSYARLDSAQFKLQKLSDNYLHLQYNKLKKDVDKKSADYIIKRRVDKINLMNEIVSAAENLKIAIGETNYRNDPTLLNNLSASFDIVRHNVQTILPMTTKQYDVEALNEILVQNKICEQSLFTLKDNWKTYNQLNDHNFLDRGLSLTMEMAKKQEAYLKRSAKSNLGHASNATNIWWWSISMSLLIGTLMAWRISRSLSDPLLELTHLAELQSDGILVSIPDSDRTDEIGKLTRSMKAHQDQTTRIVQALTNIGTSLNDLTQRLKNRSEELNETTTLQASSAEEISASVEEMLSLTENNSLEANNATSDLEKARKDMDTYISQNRKAINIMQSLISRSSSISELASQTYILSLNASIEAKRGDRNNNGFASIAHAMRELAAKVKEMAGQLNTISEQGRSSSNEAINNLNSINTIISHNQKIMHNMASTSLQQNAETSHIAAAIQHLNLQTQNTAQMVEFLTSEADHIESHSNELQEILSFFKKDNEEVSNLPQVNQWEWAELLENDENGQPEEIRETVLI